MRARRVRYPSAMIRGILIGIVLVPFLCLGALAQEDAVAKKPVAHPARVAVSTRHTGAASLRAPVQAAAPAKAVEASVRRSSSRTVSLPRVHFRH